MSDNTPPGGNPPSDPFGQPPGEPMGNPAGSTPGMTPPAGPPSYGQPGPVSPYGTAGYAEQGQPPQGYGYQPAGTYAAWINRVLATLVDILVVLPAYLIVLVGVGVSNVSEVLGSLIALIGYAAVLAIFIWNIFVKQGKSGQTIGKGVLGIKLIGEQTGQPIGAGMCFVRQIAHALDSFPCYIGYLWPLWDEKRQTFADKILSTVVIEAPKQ
ncbi:MAG: RDD family protein [Nocardioides sp.]